MDTVDRQFQALMTMLDRVPRRIQRRRVKGWRMPPNTVSVTRPGRYGNKYYPGCGLGFGSFVDGCAVDWPLRTPEDMVRHFREFIKHMKQYQPEAYEAYIAPLRGKNVACFCGLDKPCHGDVLLECAQC